MGLFQIIKKHRNEIAIVLGASTIINACTSIASKKNEYYTQSKFEQAYGHLNRNNLPDTVKVEYISNSKQNRLINVYLYLDGNNSAKLAEIKEHEFAYVQIKDENSDGKKDIVVGAYGIEDIMSIIPAQHYRFIFKGNGDGTFQVPEKKYIPKKYK